LGRGCFRGRGRGGLELVAGLAVGAAKGVLVARELDEGVVFAVPIEGDAEQAGFLVVALLADGAGPFRGGVGAVLDLAGAFQSIGVQAGFDAGHAAETPVGRGHLAEAELLDLVGGLEDVAEAVEEGLEFGGVLQGKDGVAGAEAVGLGWHRETSSERAELRCAPIKGRRGFVGGWIVELGKRLRRREIELGTGRDWKNPGRAWSAGAARGENPCIPAECRVNLW
jgi:hypothetical protein